MKELPSITRHRKKVQKILESINCDACLGEAEKALKEIKDNHNLNRIERGCRDQLYKDAVRGDSQ